MFQAAFQKSGHGVRGSIESCGDLGQGAALPVVQDKGLALRLGEPGQGIGQMDGLLVPHGLLAGRRLLGGQPSSQAGRRASRDRPRSDALERCLASAAPGPGSRRPRCGPGSPAATPPAPRRLCPGTGRASDRPREASAARDPKDPAGPSIGAKLHARQQVQVIAELFQTRRIGKITCFHRES